MKQLFQRTGSVGLTLGLLALGLWLTTGVAAAQYQTISTAEISEAQSKSIQRSRYLRKVVSVNKTQLRARPGFKLLKDQKRNRIVVIDRAVSNPPQTRFDSDYEWGVDGALVHYFCACKEEGTNPNQDFCEFEDQGNRRTTCMYKGGGESNCTCQMGVAIMDSMGGTEAVVTASGDPW